MIIYLMGECLQKQILVACNKAFVDKSEWRAHDDSEKTGEWWGDLQVALHGPDGFEVRIWSFGVVVKVSMLAI